MPTIVHVFWRDIPAQVIVGKGRRGAKAVLSERFEKAIDMCAMRNGIEDQDAYLSEWRRISVGEAEGEPTAIATAEAARLEADYDVDRLKRLIAGTGYENANHSHPNTAA